MNICDDPTGGSVHIIGPKMEEVKDDPMDHLVPVLRAGKHIKNMDYIYEIQSFNSTRFNWGKYKV